MVGEGLTNCPDGGPKRESWAGAALFRVCLSERYGMFPVDQSELLRRERPLLFLCPDKLGHMEM